ncbi:DUF2971 domain-containing protein [Pseudovibrio sp. Ad13]|uniref:DUF2971 domain-containing protein n=1 Tax=Pseudovibrio sp. Ad13 TaxID=989396 RepID=UPI00187D4C20|nr:DUF2971 domain-containing protein [Pseudovibrio sp. Ad13]
MNDPFECMISHKPNFSEDEFEYFRQNFSPKSKPFIGNKKGEWRDLKDIEVQELIKSFRDQIISGFAFCALSENPLDILMWSHYANGHKGCVIGIDFPDDINGHLKKVRYLDEPNKVDLKHFTDFHSGKTRDLTPLIENLSVKAPDWEYENEWRIWRNAPNYFHLGDYPIKEVLFGVRTPPEVKMIVLKLLDLPDNFKYNDLEVYYNPPRLVK